MREIKHNTVAVSYGGMSTTIQLLLVMEECRAQYICCELWRNVNHNTVTVSYGGMSITIQFRTVMEECQSKYN